MRGLLDEVQDHPTKVDGLREPEENVSGRALTLSAQARDLEAWRRAHHLLGSALSLRLRGDHGGQRDIAADAKLFLSRWELGSEVTTVDPPPLDVDEMVDDTDDRDQPFVRCPSGPILVEADRGRDDVFALAVEKPE
jgi:hypothetical protein